MLRKTTYLGTLLATTWLGASARAAVDLGPTSQVLDTIEQSDIAHLKSFVLPLDDGTDVLLVVESYRAVGGDADMVMTGYVAGDRDALFMLRGTEESIYGWIYFRSQKLAYEYRTDGYGLVTVEQVPVSRVCSSCDGSPPRPTVAPALNAPPIYGITANPTATEPHLGEYPGTDLLTLQSRPGATKIVYLNIAPILDSSGAPSSATASGGYSPWTKADIWRVWQTVASGLSAFEVNVTTSPTVFAATTTKNAGVANFVAQNDVSFCYQGTYGAGNYQCTIYATKPCEFDALGFGRTVLHESGHLLGMLDAGEGSNMYYEGNGTYQWYPIMGNYYYATGANAVVQWSKGEWANANSDAKIDALASISGFLGYRSDDIPGTKALTITETGAVSADSNRGQITGMTDTDTFTFEIGSSGGTATLTIDRIEYIGGAMLDVLTTLKNSSGSTIATSNPTAVRNASINQTLAAGSYSLVIQGGNEGTASNGFSAYGSIGYYGIEGTITGAVTTGTGGGAGTGGVATGGSRTGGTSTGGVATGGARTGGTSTGGVATGGARTGGTATSTTGGASTGGVLSTGGSSAGGAESAGGTATGGETTAGTGGTAPPGNEENCNCRTAGGERRSGVGWLASLFGLVALRARRRCATKKPPRLLWPCAARTRVGHHPAQLTGRRDRFS